MKDKRQRIAIAWPYAAVYSDPAFAASILQAAANSVGMPYGYPPAAAGAAAAAMLPQLPTNRLAYGFPPSVRYNPYPIPIPPQGYAGQETPMVSGYSQSSTANGIHHQSPLGMSHDPHAPMKSSPKGISVSPSSQGIRSPTTSSNSSLSPDTERIKCDFGAAPENNIERTPVKCASQEEKTVLPLMTGANSDKPNLFRPYKSEA